MYGRSYFIRIKKKILFESAMREKLKFGIIWQLIQLVTRANG